MKNHKILTSFKNLLPLTQYSYSMDVVESNWPVVATPASGTFTPLKTDYDIETNITFCISSGNCSNQHILPYTEENCPPNNPPFIEVRLKLDLPYSNQNIYGNTHKLLCEECLDVHSMSLSLIKDTNDHPIAIDVTVSDLVDGRDYSYLIESAGGNYPLCVSLTSGNFTANSTTETLSTDLYFGCPSGSCDGIIFNKTHDIFQEDILEHHVKYSVTDSCSDKTVYKNLSIEQTKSSIDISVPSNISLTADTKGCTKLTPNVNNLLKDHSYAYVYKVIDSNWPIYLDNISGVFTGDDENIDISTNLTFCPSLNACSGVNGVLASTRTNNYSMNRLDYYCNNNDNNTPYVLLNLEINSDCYPTVKTFKSDTIRVYCNNCISSPSISSK